MKKFLVAAAVLLSQSLHAEMYQSYEDNWFDAKGRPYVYWELIGGTPDDQAAVKRHIDAFVRSWRVLTSYETGSDGGQALAACVDRNARQNIGYVSRDTPFTGTTMIGQINWHVMRYQLFPTPIIIKVEIRNGKCVGSGWAGCAEVDTWPIVDYTHSDLIPGWSDSPKFRISLKQDIIQVGYRWDGIILHELFHNLGWNHSSYNGDVQMVSMQRCYENTNF